MEIVLIIVITGIVLALVGFVYQLIAEAWDDRVPPGELVTVSGRKVHLLRMGEITSPTVILEAGGSNSSGTSRNIQSKISEFAHVCAYDRAGYGFSDSVDHNRTFDEISQDLDELLSMAGASPPYILVGESMGGLMIRNYYRQYSDKVVGMVLLDAAEEQHTFALISRLKSMRKSAVVMSWLARFGVVRLLLKIAPEKFGIPRKLSTERKQELVAEISRTSFFNAAVRELGAYFSTPTDMRSASGFGDMGATPLVVVTHGKPMS